MNEDNSLGINRGSQDRYERALQKNKIEYERRSVEGDAANYVIKGDRKRAMQIAQESVARAKGPASYVWLFFMPIPVIILVNLGFIAPIIGWVLAGSFIFLDFMFSFSDVVRVAFKQLPKQTWESEQSYRSRKLAGKVLGPLAIIALIVMLSFVVLGFSVPFTLGEYELVDVWESIKGMDFTLSELQTFILD